MKIRRSRGVPGTVSRAGIAVLAVMASQFINPAPQFRTISARSFNRSFSAMALLKPITARGKGGVGAILPDALLAQRYVDFDAPYLTEALEKAGLPKASISVVNAPASDARELSDAEAAITRGDTVLIVDPLDPEVGTKIESYATAHRATVIDYDRLTEGGSRSYYVGFGTVEVGHVLGHGLVDCISAWGVKRPHVLVMKGARYDPSAALLAQGYDKILAPYFRNKTYVEVATPPGTWSPDVAATEFEAQYAKRPRINAALVPDDENAAPIITYLRRHGIGPGTFPITGQDATLAGLGNILSRYQCGTVYRPIYLEAQAAAALAVYVRAGMVPPRALVNGEVIDPSDNKAVRSVLEPAVWVTAKNMDKTVIADNFVNRRTLCSAPYATEDQCRAARITP